MKKVEIIVFITALLCFAVLVASGCSVAARKAGSVAFGKKGSIFTVSGEKAELSSYRIAKVGAFKTDVGSKSENVLAKLHEDMIEQLKKSELFHGVYGKEQLVPGQPMLLIEGKIIDYEEGSKMRRMATFGGEAFIIMRFTLKDAGSGETLAVLNSRGFIKDSFYFGGKVEDAVDQVNRGVVEFIKEHSGR